MARYTKQDLGSFGFGEAKQIPAHNGSKRPSQPTQLALSQERFVPKRLKTTKEMSKLAKKSTNSGVLSQISKNQKKMNKNFNDLNN